MKPLLLVSTATPLIVAVFTVLAAVAGLLLLPVPEDEEAAPDELHAASAAVAAAAAGSASSIRSRAGWPLIRCALPLRPGIVRIMTSCPLSWMWTNTCAFLAPGAMVADYRLSFDRRDHIWTFEVRYSRYVRCALVRIRRCR